MQNTGNFRVAASEEMRCPKCGALVNPGWSTCLSCKSMLSVVTEPVQPDTPDEPIVATPLGKIAKSRLPPETLNAEDWRSFFEERAGILEYDGGIDREKADRLAYEAAVVGLSNAMPADYPQDRCSACGSQLAPSAGLPLADRAVVCDGKCHDAHRRQQRERAEAQLAEWGMAAK